MKLQLIIDERERKVIPLIKAMINDYNMEIEYDKVFDDRLMPSIFLTSSINSKINDKDHLNLFLLILVSLNDKNWNDLHPQHLQLILKSFKEYNNSLILKPIIIEILNEE